LAELCERLAKQDVTIKTDASVPYLPPDSPDLNPIEKFFSKLKALLR
jgi:transposase